MDKAKFHRAAKTSLHLLAAELGLYQSDYDVRSNLGGPAVGGEAILHGERVYVMVTLRCVTGPQSAILYRACMGRKDYTGGRNHFHNLNLLNKPRALAFVIRTTFSREGIIL
jgi:hypothetical protein